MILVSMKHLGLFPYFLAAVLVFSNAATAHAAWVWSPESGKWTNPKNEPKDTPEEQFEWAKSFYEDKDYPRAIDEFGKLSRQFPNSQMAAEAQFYMGRCFEAQNDIGKAAEAFRTLVDRYPYSPRVTDAIEHEFELAEAMLEGKKTKFLGMAIIPAQDTAAELYKHIVKSAPYGPHGVMAQYRLGEAYLALGNLEEADRAFQAVLDNYPNSDYAMKAKYQLARTSLKASQEQEYHETATDAAIQKFDGFRQSNPPPDLETEADKAIDQLRQKKAESIYETAYFYQNRRRYKSARLYYEDIVAKFPETPVAAKARTRLEEVDKLESGKKLPKPWWRVL